MSQLAEVLGGDKELMMAGPVVGNLMAGRKP